MRASRTARMPVFWPQQLEVVLGHDRYERALTDPDSVDILTWDVFQSLETHSDQEWLAHRLQLFGGPRLRAPVRLSFRVGRDAPPRLTPSRRYIRHVQQEAGSGLDDRRLRALSAPIEVPVRVESPEVLVLIDTTLRRTNTGTEGRDRILELVDVGWEHARRLGKQLAVAAVYLSGTPAAEETSARLDELRDPGRLAAELPYLPGTPDLVLRETSWQQLLRIWEAESSYLALPTSRRPFLDHVRRRGLF